MPQNLSGILIVQRMKRKLVSARAVNTALPCFLCILWPSVLVGLGQERYVELSPSPRSFQVAASGHCAQISLDASEFPGVIRAGNDLQADVNRVTGGWSRWERIADYGRTLSSMTGVSCDGGEFAAAGEFAEP
jgi:hypothetical protein